MSQDEQPSLVVYLDLKFEVLNDRIEALRQGLTNIVGQPQRPEERMKLI